MFNMVLYEMYFFCVMANEDRNRVYIAVENGQNVSLMEGIMAFFPLCVSREDTFCFC